jgi:hypothetical protein
MNRERMALSRRAFRNSLTSGGRFDSATNVAGHSNSDDSGPVVTLEWPSSGRHLVEHDAEGKDVGAGVRLASLQLLGRHVRVGAEHGALFCQPDPARAVQNPRPLLDLVQLREAEIEQLRALPRDHHVAGLEIPMDHAACVSDVEGFGDL